MAFTRKCFRTYLGSLNSSPYRWHREGAYSHLMNEKDKRALAAVRAFSPYDLYSKSDDPVDAEALRPYYERLIVKFFPSVLDW